MSEKSDLLALLERRRGFLIATADGLTDEQARLSPTASALSIGGLIKHCTANEIAWVSFMQHGAEAFGGDLSDADWSEDESADLADEQKTWDTGGSGEVPDWVASREAEFTLLPDQTLAEVIAELTQQGARTAAVVADIDLDSSHPLPTAPWFDPGASWSGRTALAHIIAELAHHSGHADIIRETIDGTKIMADQATDTGS